MKITKQFRSESAHRIVGHGGRCAHLHGHSYLIEVTVESGKLDGLGMVLDFSEITKSVGEFIKDEWDHNLLLWVEDPLLNCLPEGSRNPYTFGENPTAEVMAKTLYNMFWGIPPFVNGITLHNIRVWETKTCFADYPGGQ